MAPGAMKVKLLSRVRLLATQWTAAYQAPRSMGFARQNYWSGLPFPSPGDTKGGQNMISGRRTELKLLPLGVADIMKL